MSQPNQKNEPQGKKNEEKEEKQEEEKKKEEEKPSNSNAASSKNESVPLRQGRPAGEYVIYVDRELGRGQFSSVLPASYLAKPVVPGKEEFAAKYCILKDNESKERFQEEADCITRIHNKFRAKYVVKLLKRFIMRSSTSSSSSATAQNKNEEASSSKTKATAATVTAKASSVSSSTSSKFDKGILIFERCRGPQLQQFLLQHGPLPIQLVQRFFAQMVDALRVTHSVDVIHRDLKPENFLLSSSHLEEAKIVLIDFGFSVKHEGREPCGSPMFMAPEICSGNLHSKPADIFALGVTLLCMIFGLQKEKSSSSSSLPNSSSSSSISSSASSPQVQNQKNQDQQQQQQQQLFDDGITLRIDPPPRSSLTPSFVRAAIPDSSPYFDQRRMLEACLDPDPRKRPTVEQLTKQGWVRSAGIEVSSTRKSGSASGTSTSSTSKSQSNSTGSSQNNNNKQQKEQKEEARKEEKKNNNDDENENDNAMTMSASDSMSSAFLTSSNSVDLLTAANSVANFVPKITTVMREEEEVQKALEQEKEVNTTKKENVAKNVKEEEKPTGRKDSITAGSDMIVATSTTSSGLLAATTAMEKKNKEEEEEEEDRKKKQQQEEENEKQKQPSSSSPTSASATTAAAGSSSSTTTTFVNNTSFAFSGLAAPDFTFFKQDLQQRVHALLVVANTHSNVPAKRATVYVKVAKLLIQETNRAVASVEKQKRQEEREREAAAKRKSKKEAVVAAVIISGEKSHHHHRQENEDEEEEGEQEEEEEEEQVEEEEEEEDNNNGEEEEEEKNLQENIRTAINKATSLTNVASVSSVSSTKSSSSRSTSPSSVPPPPTIITTQPSPPPPAAAAAVEEKQNNNRNKVVMTKKLAAALDSACSPTTSSPSFAFSSSSCSIAINPMLIEQLHWLNSQLSSMANILSRNEKLPNLETCVSEGTKSLATSALRALLMKHKECSYGKVTDVLGHVRVSLKEELSHIQELEPLRRKIDALFVRTEILQIERET